MLLFEKIFVKIEDKITQGDTNSVNTVNSKVHLTVSFSTVATKADLM